MESGCKVNRKPSPAENINCLSFATFWYAIETFIRYLKLETTESNLPQAHSKMKSEFLTALVETAWKNEIQRAGEMKTKPSLERVLLKVFGLEYLCISVLVLFGEISKIIQALAIGQLLKYSTPGQTEISKFESYFCIAVIPLCNFLYTFFVHVPFAMASNVGLKLRAACSCLIYKKCLKLDTKVLAQTTTGHIINLLSNDVGKFEQACLGGVDIFLGPLVTIFCIYLICTGIGPSAAVGIGMLLILTVVQTALSITISGYYSKSARRTDERVRLMNEIITAVQVIKMYAWEKPFSRLVDLARRQEIDKIKVSTQLKTFSYAYIIFVIRLSLFTSFLTYVLFGNEITTEKTFLLISLFNILRSPMTIFFPRFVPIIFEARISVKRIRDFLLLREKEERTDSFDQMKINFGILLTNGCAQWNKNQMTLKEVNVEVNSGEILAIIGPVGSGKSTLLQVILKELPLTSGKLAINGRVSYSSQQPWLFNGSVQQNIIFGEPMKKDRYEEVVSVCSLLRDFDQFPNGDQSIVGDRGISLSGGQKARISLARAVYKEADIYLLDDPLSAVDTEVGRNLFENCILGYLKKKVVVLVTHQLHHLGDVDKIICLNDGEVKSSGRLHDLQVSGLDMKFIASKEHKETEKKVFQEKMKHKSEVRRNIEEITKKSVITTLFFGYFKAATNYYVLSLLCLIFLLTQFFGSSVDYFMSFWVDLEESNYKTGPFSRDSSLIIYCTLIATLIGLSILLPVIFSLICMKASIKLHDDLYSSIIKATMKFFNVNSAGRILNRFSQDMGVIDGVLPAYLLDTIIMNLNVLAIIILIAILNTWLLVPVIVMATCAYCLRKVYVKVGRNIKNLQARTLSPIFAHTNATLQDLTTIRALGAENILQKEFESHQDLHTAAFFDFISTARFFGLYLDCLCALMVAAVVFIFFFTEGNSSSHFGLAITQATMLTGIFQWSIKVTCEVENQSVSVDRVLEYQNIEHEQRRVSQSKVPKLWPENGKIIFKSVSLHYYPEDPPTLKDLSFTILPKEKVGIVGRTGAGKSSIINAIFQLTETEGSLIIDEIDVKSVNLQDLRSRISIIPQEPFLFSGTIRRNLDPFSQYPDTVLWRVLADVELKNVVSDLSSGLEAEVSEEGSNFSVGQRQLVCLARAILRNNKILILDEATANIDPQTDALIQNTIRRKFIDCTVLTVAHRLDTVMDSDKILVLEDGTVSQFGHPHDLLQDQNGPFHRLVQETGKATAERLIAIAELNFYKMRQ